MPATTSLRLLLPARRSTRSAPRPSLLTAAGRCDASAVMRLAHELARDDVADAARRGRTRRYKVALRDALRSAWSTAQTQAWCHRRDAETATAAALNDRTALIAAELRFERAAADSIDGLAAHLSAVASVEARAAAAGIRL